MLQLGLLPMLLLVDGMVLMMAFPSIYLVINNSVSACCDRRRKFAFDVAIAALVAICSCHVFRVLQNAAGVPRHTRAAGDH